MTFPEFQQNTANRKQRAYDTQEKYRKENVKWYTLPSKITENTEITKNEKSKCCTW